MMTPLDSLLARYGVRFHFYADDTQIYISVSPKDTRQHQGLSELIPNLLQDIKSWMDAHMLKLNEDKTEYIFIKSFRQTNPLPDLVPSSVTMARNLGVIIDQHLSFGPHIDGVVKSVNFILYRLSLIRDHLDRETAQLLVQALVISRLDYCNSVLSGCSTSLLSKLQRLQNRAARLVLDAPKYSPSTPLLKQLHWLPVRLRVEYKILSLVHKSLYHTAPSYLQDLISAYSPPRTLRSGGQSMLVVPKTRTTFGDRAFSVTGPRLFNELPRDLREVTSSVQFLRRLKTHLYDRF